MLKDQVKDVYHRMLSAPAESPTGVELRCQVVISIHACLIGEDVQMMTAETDCR